MENPKKVSYMYLLVKTTTSESSNLEGGRIYASSKKRLLVRVFSCKEEARRVYNRLPERQYVKVFNTSIQIIREGYEVERIQEGRLFWYGTETWPKEEPGFRVKAGSSHDLGYIFIVGSIDPMEYEGKQIRVGYNLFSY